jgi:hypothetical protein
VLFVVELTVSLRNLTSQERRNDIGEPSVEILNCGPSFTPRSSPAVTFAIPPSRTSWCSGRERVQATQRALARTRLLLGFPQPPRLLSAFAPFRTCRRVNTLAWPKYLPGKYLLGIVMCWNI